MWIFILIILALSIGAYTGWRAGVYFIKKENTTLQNQIDLLEAYANHWAGEATNKYQLSENLSNSQNKNLSNTMNTVIQILQTAEHQSLRNQQIEEQQQINKLIQEAKNITTHNDTYSL